MLHRARSLNAATVRHQLTPLFHFGHLFKIYLQLVEVINKQLHVQLLVNLLWYENKE